jgi:hypothetical protein
MPMPRKRAQNMRYPKQGSSSIIRVIRCTSSSSTIGVR